MLIGMNAPAAKTNTSSEGDVFEVTALNFESAVLNASAEKPILIDFWAPWCGPCRQLMPLLEKAVLSRGGDVALAKVNVDENPELSQAFRVQSVPTVIALYMGQPVSGFTGVRPASDIEALLDQLVALHKKNQPEKLDIPAILKQAATHLEQGQIEQAEAFYAQILAQNPTETEAYVGLVRCALAGDDTVGAADLIENAPEAILKDPRFGAAKTALDLAMNKSAVDHNMAELEARLLAAPDNLEVRFEFAEACFAKGWKEAAVDALIEIIRRNKTWDDEKARKQLLKYFEAWGFSDPVSIAGRRKLSTLLFS